MPPRRTSPTVALSGPEAKVSWNGVPTFAVQPATSGRLTGMVVGGGVVLTVRPFRRAAVVVAEPSRRSTVQSAGSREDDRWMRAAPDRSFRPIATRRP